MDNVKLQLDTNYKKVGNSSGMQVDTLSIAVCGSDYNEICEMSDDYIHSRTEYVIEHYNYERDFLASLTKAQAEQYVKDAQGYAEALDEFKETLAERARGQNWQEELEATHPLYIEIEKEEGDAYDDLRKEWLHGDYREAGLLRDASRKYSVDFHYDEKTDTLTFDIDDDECDYLCECNGIKKTKKAVAEYLANSIENDAYAQNEKKKAQREKNREAYETRKRIEAERKAEAEAERIRKLKAVA